MSQHIKPSHATHKKIFQNHEPTRKSHGFQYVDGLNRDKLPFSETGSCVPGGLYFTERDIHTFIL